MLVCEIMRPLWRVRPRTIAPPPIIPAWFPASAEGRGEVGSFRMQTTGFLRSDCKSFNFNQRGSRRVVRTRTLNYATPRGGIFRRIYFRIMLKPGRESFAKLTSAHSSEANRLYRNLARLLPRPFERYLASPLDKTPFFSRIIHGWFARRNLTAHACRKIATAGSFTGVQGSDLHIMLTDLSRSIGPVIIVPFSSPCRAPLPRFPTPSGFPLFPADFFIPLCEAIKAFQAASLDTTDPAFLEYRIFTSLVRFWKRRRRSREVYRVLSNFLRIL